MVDEVVSDAWRVSIQSVTMTSEVSGDSGGSARVRWTELNPQPLPGAGIDRRRGRGQRRKRWQFLFTIDRRIVFGSLMVG